MPPCTIYKTKVEKYSQDSNRLVSYYDRYDDVKMRKCCNEQFKMMTTGGREENGTPHLFVSNNLDLFCNNPSGRRPKTHMYFITPVPNQNI